MWALIAAGLLGRVVLGAVTYGGEYDIASSATTARLLLGAPLDVYEAYTGIGSMQASWPYGPGLFGWLLAAHGLAGATGIPFHAVVGLAPVAADAGIAWLVQDHLRRTGAGERTRLAAVALVMLGTTFALNSGFQHQFDSVAILPAVAAVWLWERRPPGRRAVACGALIAAGALCKSVPIVVLLALLPCARDRKEAATLVAVTAGLLLAATAPWILWDPQILEAVRYAGFPGAGGLSLALWPAGAQIWLGHEEPLDGAALWLLTHRMAWNLALAGALALLLLRARPRPAAGAALVMLGIYALGTGFFFGYLVWGLPFLLMAGHLRAVLAIQAASLVPNLLILGTPWESEAVPVLYAAVMIPLWAAFAVALAVMGRRMLVAR